MSSTGGGGAGSDEDLEVLLSVDFVEGLCRLDVVLTSSSESSATMKSSMSISAS